MTGSKNHSKKQNFFKGALVLGIANIIVKFISACFKIPLFNLIGDEGSGLFNVAYMIYTFMLSIATAGFPVAISKMVSERVASGSEHEADKVFKVALRFLSALGLICTLLMLLFADKLATIAGISDAAHGIKLIAPAVFFVSITSVFHGYFQGKQNMCPTALSQVIESSGKLILGLLGAYFFTSMTVNSVLTSTIDFKKWEISSLHLQTIYASSGSLFGVTAGSFFACAFMIVIYFIQRRKADASQLIKSTTPNSEILKKLITIAIPITIGASVSSLTGLIDMGTITHRLVSNPETLDKYAFMFSEGTTFFKKAIAEGWSDSELLSQKASALYGMYTGKAVTIFNFPLTLVVALGTSVLPAISSAIVRNKRDEAERITISTLKIVILFAAPCAIGLSVLSKDILNLLFGDYNAHIVLSILSLSIIPVTLVQISTSILQAYGKIHKPVFHMIIGCFSKIIVNYFCIPHLGINGAPVGTGICYLVIALLNIKDIVKMTDIKIKWGVFIIRPILAASVMGIVGFILSHVLPISKTACILEIAICVIVYVIAIFLVRAVQKEDIIILPKGEKIVKMLKKYKLIKD